MDRNERIKRYLAAVPPCVEGEGGDSQLFKVACLLFNGFALSEIETLSWLKHYNTKCLPPWDESRLIYKTGEAIRVSHAKPRGHLLEGRSTVVVPSRIAATRTVRGTFVKTYHLATEATHLSSILEGISTPISGVLEPKKEDQELSARMLKRCVASVAKRNLRESNIWKVIPAPPPLAFPDVYMAHLVDDFANDWCYRNRYWLHYLEQPVAVPWIAPTYNG